MATATATETNGRVTRFEWSKETPENIALEILKRNPDRVEPIEAHDDLLSPCLICETTVQEKQHYLRSGENSQKLTHYGCIWTSLPAPVAKFLKEAWEAGTAITDSLIKKAYKAATSTTSSTTKKVEKEKRKYERKEASTPAQTMTMKEIVQSAAMASEESAVKAKEKKAVKVDAKPKEDYDVQELSLADMNFKMGKTEGTLEALQKENDLLRAHVVRLETQIADQFKLVPDILSAAAKGVRQST